MFEQDLLVLTLGKWIEVFMRRSMQHFFLYSKEIGLSMPQIGAMFQIMHKGTSGVTNLGGEMGVTSAAASQMLERLVQQGLILRSEDPHDRRVKQIVLSDKGRQVIQESIQARQGWMNKLAASLSPAEKEQIIAAIQILIDKTLQLENTPTMENSK